MRYRYSDDDDAVCRCGHVEADHVSVERDGPRVVCDVPRCPCIKFYDSQEEA